MSHACGRENDYDLLFNVYWMDFMLFKNVEISK